MTSMAGTDEHPEVAEISAFAEGLLSPERSAELRGHLAHCVLCADVRDSLSEIRGILGTLPGPPRMPEDVAGRIDAALAAEALIQATTPDPTPRAAHTEPDTAASRDAAHSAHPADAADAADAPGAPDSADRAIAASGASPGSAAAPAGRAHVSRETSPSAARPAGRPGAATGPGRGARGSRRRWRIVTAASAVAVLGVGGLLVYSLDGQGSTSTQAGVFSGHQLQSQVHQLLGAAGQQASPNAGAQSGENSPFATKVPVVPSCVLKATGRPDGPIATSRGSYEGHSSYLLVLAHPSDSGKVDAYVVDAACAAHGSSGPVKAGTVLTERTYSRH